jgi:hypothetical protein
MNPLFNPFKQKQLGDRMDRWDSVTDSYYIVYILKHNMTLTLAFN